MSTQTLESDLGFEPDEPARVPSESTVTGAPEWLLTGLFIEAIGEGDDTRLEDLVGGRAAFTPRRMSEGLYIAASRKGGSVSVYNLTN